MSMNFADSNLAEASEFTACGVWETSINHDFSFFPLYLSSVFFSIGLSSASRDRCLFYFIMFFSSLLLIWRLFRFITVDLTALERKRLLQHGGQAPGDRVIGVCNTYFRSPINFFLAKSLVERIFSLIYAARMQISTRQDVCNC